MTIHLHIPDGAAERIPVIAIAALASKYGCHVEAKFKAGEIHLTMVPRWRGVKCANGQ